MTLDGRRADHRGPSLILTLSGLTSLRCIADAALGLMRTRPDKVAKRHARGYRTARENLADLIDEGTFVEYGPLALAAQTERRSLAGGPHQEHHLATVLWQVLVGSIHIYSPRAIRA